MNNPSVVIIGGGVIGMASAYYASQAGFQVTVIDRDAQSTESSCASGSAGMVVPSHFVPLAAPGMIGTAMRMMFNPRSPFYMKPKWDLEMFRWGLAFAKASTRNHVNASAPLIRDLNLASRKLFVELANQSGNPFGFVQKGLLMLCHTQQGFEHEKQTAHHAAQLGLEARIADAKTISSIEPALSMDIAGGVYFPQDCHLNPSEFLKKLKMQAQSRGMKMLEWNPADSIGFMRSKGTIDAIRLGDRVIEADQFVLAAGAWSSSEAAKLGIRLPMQPGKGYSLTLNHPRELPEICAILTEARVAITPMNGSLRFAGTMEFDGFNATIQPRRLEGMIQSSLKYLPAFKAKDFESVQPWSGFRPCSPDGLPYLGRSQTIGNLIIATGHAMMGLSLAPVTGKLVTDLLLNHPWEMDASLLNPERFNAPNNS